MDGSEVIYTMFLPAILQKELNISDTQVALMASVMFIGSFLGNLFAGVLSDIIGRKITMICGNSVELVCFIYLYFAKTYWEIIVIRTLFGASLGITLPISYLVISEIVPYNIRGKLLIALQVSLTLGHFYYILLASIYMETLTKGNWRIIALWNALPCFLMLLGNILLLDETARHHIIKQEYEKGFQILDKMIKQNHEGQENIKFITQQEKEIIIQWRNVAFLQEYSPWERFTGLFNHENYPVTIRLLFMILAVNMVGSGISFLMPFLFENGNFGLFEVFLATLGELPALIIDFILIDDKDVGRKKLINVGLFISMVITFRIFLGREQFLVIGLIILKICVKLGFAIMLPLIAEAYSTVYRAMGLSTAGSLGRIGSAIGPFILFPIFQQNNYAPFLFFTLMFGVALIAMIPFPIDTTMNELDQTQKFRDYQNNNQQYGTYQQIPQQVGNRVNPENEFDNDI